ncbi:unnamed protein product [Rotaria sordida]|uniref:PABC domain-containing protein n=1 Tax=Rotaria sordida TaxID=392033 RepID=A0A815N9W8_9BILA|nr:unnamed protein product [Rotaria sordida]CAF1385860.1 unnamed protein product [Rotaria sordida]CAF1426743.1 unnamed protein product [Rotaria sordida]CAF3942850.1 unnamed protein product [Rotaria sordida]
MATNNNVQMKIENDNHLSQYDDHVLFIYINQWENHSIAKIQLTAQQARNDLQGIFNKKRQDFANLLNQINKEVDTNSHENINLSKCVEQLDKLRQDLSNLSTCIYLEHDKNESPIHLIKLFYKNNNQIKQIDDNTNDENINVPGTEPLTPAMLRDVTLTEQKQLLGERLFVLVQQIEPTSAAKITGMLIELDTQYILILIKSQKILKEKIKEAINILQAYQYKQRYMTKS